MKTAFSRCLALATLLLAIAGCPATGPASTATELSAERPPILDAPALASQCEPAQCGTFCAAASCVFSDARDCLETCKARCGDAYFEPADLELMQCVQASPSCEGAKGCCHAHFTSQLCD